MTYTRGFWLHIEFTSSCWLWTGARRGGRRGRRYGEISVGGRVWYAHRWASAMVYGPIPPGIEIDHRCGVPLCVRPSHLDRVTKAENLRRRKTGDAP